MVSADAGDLPARQRSMVTRASMSPWSSKYIAMRGPLLPRHLIGRQHQAGQLMNMLAGVIEVHDQNSASKLFLGNIPNPDRPIAENDFATGSRPTPLKCFAVDAAGKLIGIFDRARVGSRSF